MLRTLLVMALAAGAHSLDYRYSTDRTFSAQRHPHYAYEGRLHTYHVYNESTADWWGGQAICRSHDYEGLAVIDDDFDVPVLQHIVQGAARRQPAVYYVDGQINFSCNKKAADIPYDDFFLNVTMGIDVGNYKKGDLPKPVERLFLRLNKHSQQKGWAFRRRYFKVSNVEMCRRGAFAQCHASKRNYAYEEIASYLWPRVGESPQSVIGEWRSLSAGCVSRSRCACSYLGGTGGQQAAVQRTGKSAKRNARLAHGGGDSPSSRLIAGGGVSLGDDGEPVRVTNAMFSRARIVPCDCYGKRHFVCRKWRGRRRDDGGGGTHAGDKSEL